MVNQHWKSRAESMISQLLLIEGGSDDISGDSLDTHNDHNTYTTLYTPENYSTSNKYDYDTSLYGCGTFCPSDSNGQCVSLLMQWVRFVVAGTIKAYLSSPICLALLPLIIGVGFGYWIGYRNGNNNGTRTTSVKDYDRRKDTTIRGCVSQLYSWATLHMMIILVYIDPRKLWLKNSSLQLFDEKRDEQTRTELKTMESKRQSGVESQYLPRHIAVIMDGNRRHGKAKYNNATRGHWDGCETLVEFAKWCIDEEIQILTVYAFSTENWDRNPAEVSALMTIFCKYCDELRIEALKLGIRVHALTTDDEKIPENVQLGIDRMVYETRHCDKFTMNICLSYGGRGEIANACKSIARDVQCGTIDANQVDESEVHKRMLTEHCSCDPDIIIRTSGEERLSNFLLWQAAYSELFFLKKLWPELQKEDLLRVIRTFAQGRSRRYGK